MNFFKNIFKSTTKKVDNAVDSIVNDTKQIMSNANSLVDESKDKLKMTTYVICGSFLLNVVTNLVTLYCCTQVVKSVHRNDVLNDIAKMLHKK